MTIIQLKLFKDPSRLDIIERLGGLRRLQLSDGTAVVMPSSILHLADRQRVAVYRILDPIPRWMTASLECVPIGRNEADYADRVPEVWMYPDQFIKGKTLKIYPSQTLWKFEPSKQRDRPQPQISRRRLEQFIWDWLIQGEHLGSAFARNRLRANLEERDRLSLNNLHSTTLAKVQRRTEDLNESMDADDFDLIFWRSLDIVCSYRVQEQLPEQFPKQLFVPTIRPNYSP
jgi:hypothetical protein